MCGFAAKLKIIAIFLSILFFSGCAHFKEGTKVFLGTSTAEIESARANALKKSFAIEYEKCYEKTREVLRKNGCYIYARSSDMIAFYVSQDDTTPVGVFFVKNGQADTQVEVASKSSYAKENIASKIFMELDAVAELSKKQEEVLVNEQK